VPLDHEGLVIGSGFGGAIACCRLAQRWPGRVLLLERGKRWPAGSFPRSPTALAQAFWSPQTLGLFDLRHQKGMDLVVSAGLGGGSLIYANVFLPAPAHRFEQGWPQGLDARRLAPYYDVARRVLGATPLPEHLAPGRAEELADFARRLGRPCHPAELCVTFAPPDRPPRPGGRNAHGAPQGECQLCGECDLGCNLQAKNSLDLNYLYAAEHHHGAEIRTGAQVERITPLDAQGREATDADGRHGYAVHYRELPGGAMRRVTARRVVVAAGALGTTELLLRCRDRHHSLPRLSPALGHRMSGNGDFVAFATQTRRALPANAGPVITRWVDHHLFDDLDPRRAFILEDAAYPALLAWYLEGVRPALDPMGLLRKGRRLAGRLWHRWVRRDRWYGSLGHLAREALDDSYSSRTRVLLFMGLDEAQGRMTLVGDQMQLHWPHRPSLALYQAQLALARAFGDFGGARHTLPLPTWRWPLRRNISVHPLGGCALADDPHHGVTDGNEDRRGRLFGYQGLYVTDGALMPMALGANPSATICALAEWICEGITGRAPDSHLGKGS